MLPLKHVTKTTPLTVSLNTLVGFGHCEEVAKVVIVLPVIDITEAFIPSRQVAYNTPLNVSLNTLLGEGHCEEVARVVIVLPSIAMTEESQQAA
jgi:hypothetical protein